MGPRFRKGDVVGALTCDGGGKLVITRIYTGMDND